MMMTYLTELSEAQLILAVGPLDLVGIIDVDPVLPVALSKQGCQRR